MSETLTERRKSRTRCVAGGCWGRARSLRRGVLPLVLTLAAACQPLPSEPVARGNTLFDYCRPCHGASGGGKPELLAPPIGGLPAWYVEAQLVKFRAGGRGSHIDDLEGMRMRPMALTLHAEQDVKAVAGHVASLPKAKSQVTVYGDPAKGLALFGSCVACHGQGGVGLEAMKAPPLAGQADWYLAAQLTKFRKGIRGASALDASGMLMRPMAMALPDDKAVKDVVAYIATLDARPSAPVAAK